MLEPPKSPTPEERPPTFSSEPTPSSNPPGTMTEPAASASAPVVDPVRRALAKLFRAMERLDADPTRRLASASMERDELAAILECAGASIGVDLARRPGADRDGWFNLAGDGFPPLKVVDSRITCPRCGGFCTSLLATTVDVDLARAGAGGVETWRCDSTARVDRDGGVVDDMLCGHVWTRDMRSPISSVIFILQDSEGLILGEVRGSRIVLPGGKLEPGEDVVAALSREMQEELGALVTMAYPLTTTLRSKEFARDHTGGEGPEFRVQPFLVTDWEMMPGRAEMPKVTQDGHARPLVWVSPEELMAHEYPNIRDMVREATSLRRALAQGLAREPYTPGKL